MLLYGGRVDLLLQVLPHHEPGPGRLSPQGRLAVWACVCMYIRAREKSHRHFRVIIKKKKNVNQETDGRKDRRNDRRTETGTRVSSPEHPWFSLCSRRDTEDEKLYRNSLPLYSKPPERVKMRVTSLPSVVLILIPVGIRFDVDKLSRKKCLLPFSGLGSGVCDHFAAVIKSH